MRKLALVLVLAAPVAVVAQYIGNPCGKVIPRGAPGERHRVACGFAGLDFGYGRIDVDGDYDVTSDGSAYRLASTSDLKESYFALSGGCYLEGFEFEGRLGGTWIDIEDDALTSDPLDDSGGVLVGFGARYGFSPCDFLRLGIGGQMHYSYTEGDTLVSDGMSVWNEDVALDLVRGQIFTGLGLDLEASREVVFSPYVGAGLEFISGELTIHEDDPYDWDWFEEEIGEIEEDRSAFVFGGVDLHLGERGRIGLEGRTNFDGWLAQVSFGVRF